MARIALFFLLVFFVAFLGFWLLGMLYGLLFRRPAVWFPARLAATMAAAGIVGAVAGGVGGIVLSTVVMDRAFAKREDYRTLPVVVAGALISTVVLAGTLFAAYALAWQVFD